MNHLGDNFYTFPYHAKTTMTRKELKSTLLETDGVIFSCGKTWDVRSKHIGVGVYKV